MPIHAFFATRAEHRPTRPEPTAATVTLMRPLRSPLFRWDDLRGSGVASRSKAQGHKRAGGAGKAPQRRFTLTERNTGVLSRTFDLDSWILDIMDHCDGRRTVREIASDPSLLPTVPGASDGEKAQKAMQLMQFFGQQEILLLNI